MKYCIASCMFTSRFPQLSRKIQNYIAERRDIEIIRCCTPSWEVKFYEEKMPEDEIWSICHNCTNIAEEYFHVENVHSIWELIDEDGQFVFPDYSCLKVTVQDCWRSKGRPKEQAAVRSSALYDGVSEKPQNGTEALCAEHRGTFSASHRRRTETDNGGILQSVQDGHGCMLLSLLP